MSGHPKARQALLIMAGLLVITALGYRFFGPAEDDRAIATGDPLAAQQIAVMCEVDLLTEDQIAATHLELAGQVEQEFPLTDFSIRSIALDEISYDGNTRDSIPPVGTPTFVPISQAGDIGDLEPVLSIGINGDYRAYPLRILLWHEIVNDEVGGVPVLISYCPLCNSGVVFDRRIDGQVVEFGNTGRIRFHDMVMYDKGTESWWQQATGQAIIGEMSGTCMTPLPARLESVARFRARAPDGQLLVPEDAGARPYGSSPFASFRDIEQLPLAVSRTYFPYDVPEGVNPLERVVVVGDQGWTVSLLRDAGQLEADGLVFEWTVGQNSIHDNDTISAGRDVGNVTVQRNAPGDPVDVPYDVTFAFAFAAFHPDGALHTSASEAPTAD